jgi:hypothetical protein
MSGGIIMAHIIMGGISAVIVLIFTVEVLNILTLIGA